MSDDSLGDWGGYAMYRFDDTLYLRLISSVQNYEFWMKMSHGGAVGLDALPDGFMERAEAVTKKYNEEILDD